MTPTRATPPVQRSDRRALYVAIAAAVIGLPIMVCCVIPFFNGLARGVLGGLTDASVTSGPFAAPTPQLVTETYPQILAEWDGMTKAQQAEFRQRLIGKQVQWSGTVDDVREDGDIRIDAGQKANQYLVLQQVPRDTRLALNKGQRVSFTATIKDFEQGLLTTSMWLNNVRFAQ